MIQPLHIHVQAKHSRRLSVHQSVSFLTYAECDAECDAETTDVSNAGSNWSSSSAERTWILYSKCVSQIDQKLDDALEEFGFFDKVVNIIITSKTSVVKSDIATALGKQACTLCYRVI